MPKFVDKWALPVAFVLIGGVIAWALWQRLMVPPANGIVKF